MGTISAEGTPSFHTCDSEDLFRKGRLPWHPQEKWSEESCDRERERRKQAIPDQIHILFETGEDPILLPGRQLCLVPEFGMTVSITFLPGHCGSIIPEALTSFMKNRLGKHLALRTEKSR